jgi:hypothetical protein
MIDPTQHNAIIAGLREFDSQDRGIDTEAILRVAMSSHPEAPAFRQAVRAWNGTATMPSSSRLYELLCEIEGKPVDGWKLVAVRNAGDRHRWRVVRTSQSQGTCPDIGRRRS